MQARRVIVYVAVAGAWMLSMGCSTPRVRHVYGGEERPLSEVAIVCGTTNFGIRSVGPGRERLTILSVDGKNTVPFYSLASPPRAVAVLPGRRELGLQYEYVHGVARSTLWVDAISNHIYQIKVMNPGDRTTRVYFMVQDITAQNLVGGSEKQADQRVAP